MSFVSLIFIVSLPPVSILKQRDKYIEYFSNMQNKNKEILYFSLNIFYIIDNERKR